MSRLIKSLLWAAAAVMLVGSSTVLAQPAGGGGRGNRGNMDPAQMRQARMDRMKQELGVTNDDEWKVIQDRIEKVQEAQRETRAGAFGMMGGRRGGQNGGATDQNAQNAQRRGNRGGGMFTPTPNPAAEALRTALDDNASADLIKAKLAAYRDSRKAAEAKLEKAQADLQKVVTAKQEARLVLMGLLK